MGSREPTPDEKAGSEEGTQAGAEAGRDPVEILERKVCGDRRCKLSSICMYLPAY